VYLLEIKELKAGIKGKEILKGINLKIKKGEIHAIMGLNGSGKSTLANVLMGHPAYQIKKGKIKFNGKNLLKMSTDERAKEGIFLAFQHPSEIAGIKNSVFIKTALNEIRKARKEKAMNIKEFKEKLKEKSQQLKMKELTERYLNEGFSGGEKKRNEILQMLMMEPKLAILDEIDSGLDIDALKLVTKEINSMKKKDNAIIIITHYERILKYIKPDFVHIIHKGKIIKSGSFKLALKINEKGYKAIIEEKKKNGEKK
jgi:Fe-S cluster assembly ATP-binding protein